MDFSELARVVIEENPQSGHLFVFFNRTKDRTKILCGIARAASAPQAAPKSVASISSIARGASRMSSS
ncbi:MAG: hypothetical protein IPK72_21010 [Candidatus Eisenbacteria bacterium]|nr:hypothetical protein [Candidatus Eisenbacteria bacterium]